MVGILGLDRLDGDKNTYRISTKLTGGKAQSSFYPYGLSGKLFTSKSEHERIKKIFKNFEKSLDSEIKQSEVNQAKYIEA